MTDFNFNIDLENESTAQDLETAISNWGNPVENLNRTVTNLTLVSNEIAITDLVSFGRHIDESFTLEAWPVGMTKSEAEQSGDLRTHGF